MDIFWYPLLSGVLLECFSTQSRPGRRNFTKVQVQRIVHKFLLPGYPFTATQYFLYFITVFFAVFDFLVPQAFFTFLVCTTARRNPCAIVNHYIIQVKLYIFQ